MVPSGQYTFLGDNLDFPKVKKLKKLFLMCDPAQKFIFFAQNYTLKLLIALKKPILVSGVAQLVGRLLPVPDVRGLNPVIVKILFIYWTFVYCHLSIEKTKIKKKRPGMAHLKKPFLVLSVKEEM